MEKRIKYRLFHYYEPTGQKDAAGNDLLVEKNAAFGQLADISREEDIERGEKLGAFFSDEESAAIEDGTYRGPAYDQLRSNAGSPAEGSEQGQLGAGGDVPDITGMDSADVAEIIQTGGEGGGSLNVNETVALAKNDKDLAELVLDAEIIASESDPRKGVEKGLEAIISRANSQPQEDGN